MRRESRFWLRRFSEAMTLDLGSLCRFLESLYTELGPGWGCLRESPRVEAGVCYTNTNSLALHALEICGSSIVPGVSAFLRRYDRWRSGRFEVLWLEEIPYPPPLVAQVVLDRVYYGGGFVEVKAEVPTEGFLPDWQMYADLLILGALEMLRRGEYGIAMSLRGRAARMWDGRGFADKAYRASGLYEAYKLSLYYFLVRALGIGDSISEAIPGIIGRVVRGGVVTHYTGGLEARGDPNVETTSVTILAFYSDYPEAYAVREPGVSLPSTVFVALLAALLAWRMRRLLGRRKGQP